MKSILYVSVADPNLDSAEVAELADLAVERNRASAISGIMLYNGTNFLQLIEGEAEPLDECFSRISDDPRHSGVIVLREEEMSVREFPEWAMRYCLVEQPVQDTLAVVRTSGAPRVDTLDRISAFVGLNRRGR